LPLTVADEPSGNGGGMLKITRQPHGYTAYFISRVGIFPCIGVWDPEANAQLQEAFRRPAWKTVQSLWRDPHALTETCWLHQQECCLSTAALPRDGRC
jgi:protein-L-isoaspartate(D-aspartate) O-methyltransferase